MFTASLAVASLSVPVEGQTHWRIVSHEVSFEIRNAGLPVRGTFGDLVVEIVFDPADLASAGFTGRIDPASIETGIPLRDRHLTGRQFFDVRRYPVIEMRAVAIEPAEQPETYRGEFELRIRDVTAQEPVLFRFERAGDQAALSGTMTIDRVSYGVGDGGFLLGDDVTVTVVLTLERLRDQGAPSS